MATRGGRCNPVAGVIFHTVHGTPYTADAFRRACRSLHVTQSMGTVDGNCGSAMPEWFFSSAKGEVVDGEHFATRAEARREIFTWLDWYNAARLHGSLAYRPPIE